MDAFDLKFTTLFTLTGTVLHYMVVLCTAFHGGTMYCITWWYYVLCTA